MQDLSVDVGPKYRERLSIRSVVYPTLCVRKQSLLNVPGWQGRKGWHPEFGGAPVLGSGLDPKSFAADIFYSPIQLLWNKLQHS